MYLCIDTITAESGIALVEKSRVMSFIPLESRHSSDGLFGAVEKLFQDTKVQLSDLQGVAVIKGPGSFTSVRVGVAVANQFSHQLKIPIIGLTADEWYRFKTDEKDFFYLQTMNRDEVYAVGFGKWKDEIKNYIIPLVDLPKVKAVHWIGQLISDHLSLLPNTHKAIASTRNTPETWSNACESVFLHAQKQKTYELVDPYYGKEPHVTESKRRFKIGKIQ